LVDGDADPSVASDGTDVQNTVAMNADLVEVSQNAAGENEVGTVVPQEGKKKRRRRRRKKKTKEAPNAAGQPEGTPADTSPPENSGTPDQQQGDSSRAKRGSAMLEAMQDEVAEQKTQHIRTTEILEGLRRGLGLGAELVARRPLFLSENTGIGSAARHVMKPTATPILRFTAYPQPTRSS
jgi:hypothetical protein